jgi:NAD(P)-dependent dehydrogenase (short-subunit alcohol dehydrogenase family)
VTEELERMEEMRGVEVDRDGSPVAVVTGAGSELGRATALLLAARGYQLVLVDLDERKMAEIAMSIQAGGAKSRTFCTDVSDARRLGDMVREVANEISLPALLVNIVSSGTSGSVIETSDEEWSRVLAANLTGPFLVTRAIVPLMIDRGGGVIINVTSAVACLGSRRRAAYCASAAGLVGLTRAVALDHASDSVRCVAICDGGSGELDVVEPSTTGSRLDRSDELATGGPSGRGPASTEEVAAIIAFVAGSCGRVFNGKAMLLDGDTLARQETASYASI